MNLCLAMGLVTQKSRSHSRLPDQAPPMEQSKVKSPDEFSIKEISPGALELGSVRLNQAQRSIAFSAKVQHARRPYQIPFSDISHGKVNESVFVCAHTQPQLNPIVGAKKVLPCGNGFNNLGST